MGRTTPEDGWRLLEFAEGPLATIVREIAKEYRLTNKQTMFLVKRPICKTDAEACMAVGVRPETLSLWKVGGSNRPDFGTAYRRLMSSIVDLVDHEMQSMLLKTARTTDQLLDATRVISTENGNVEIPDYRARAKGVELVWRWVGKWQEHADRSEDPKYVRVLDRYATYLAKLQENSVDGEVKLLETPDEEVDFGEETTN